MRILVTIFAIISLLIGCQIPLKAQKDTIIEQYSQEESPLSYQLIYDEPDSINKLWVNFFPMYGDAFATNFSIGYGGQLQYFHKKRFNISLSAHHAYAKNFDIARNAGEKNKTVNNELRSYRFFELAGTYHIKDDTKVGSSKIIPYSKGISPEKLASTVPTFTKIPSQVRRITGIRAGAYSWLSTINLTDVAQQQNVAFIATDNSDTLASSEKVYTTITSTGFFIGGSLTRIRNIFIKPTDSEPVTNDDIFTMYVDVMAAMTDILPIEKNNLNYSVANIRKQPWGARFGVQGLFNRSLGWTYQAEIGWRPSVEKRNFFALLKIGFSLSSDLRLKRNSNISNE